MEKRARARFHDKERADRIAEKAVNAKSKPWTPKLKISEKQFVAWYCAQPDACHYCGVTYDDLHRLRLRRGGFGYFVSWDIDRIDSSKAYQEGNLALSCFVCNMAKGNLFTEMEAQELGKAVRKVYKRRLAG